MSRRAPLDLRFRPQPIDTLEVERSADVAARLLEAPSDWLGRLLSARLDVSLDKPQRSHLRADQRVGLESAGFRPLATASVRHLTPLGRIERRVDVWLDPSATIRAEVVGEQPARVYFATTFDDGSSLVLLPDPNVADWVSSASCEVVVGSGDVRADLTAFGARAAALRRTRTPLRCANGEAYSMHLHLAARRGKRPRNLVGCGERGIMYPMTLLLAAEMVARRDDFADAVGCLPLTR